MYSFPMMLFSRFRNFMKAVDRVLYYFFAKLSGVVMSVESDKPALLHKYKSERERYIEESKIKYLSTFDADPNGEIYCSNILYIFYLRKEFKALMANADNMIEKTWKSRVLIETTPYGLIIMYYDAYKEGFAYYSNQTGIPYDIMNAVVMKYVRIFRCRDFFIDEMVNTVERESPFLRFLKMEDSDEQKKKRNAVMTLNKSSTGLGLGSDLPFVKFKGATAVKTETVKIDDKGKEKEKEKEKENTVIYKNKIIFLGKTVNYNFLIPVVKTRENRAHTVKPKISFNTELFNELFSIKEDQIEIGSEDDADADIKKIESEDVILSIKNVEHAIVNDENDKEEKENETDTEAYKSSYAYYKKMRCKK